MSTITLPTTVNSAKLLTYQRLDGADLANIQAVAVVNQLANVVAGITAAGQSASTPCPDAGLALVVLSGTFTGINLAFEASVNNTDWVPVLASRVDGGGLETTSGVLSTVARAWAISTAGFSYVRARALAYGTGTGSVIIGMSPDSVTPAPTASIGAKATGGAALFRLLSAASTNSTLVKAAPGNVYSLHVSNTGAAVAFLKLYNKATAPTVGTDTPVMTILIPVNASMPVALPADIGASFSAGISLAITGAVADTDTTAVAANQVVVNATYA